MADLGGLAAQIVEMNIPDEILARLPASDNLSTPNPQPEQVQNEVLSTKDSTLNIMEKELEELEKKEEEIKSLKLVRSSSEKSLEGYVYDNIIRLWKEIFDEEIILCERQKQEVVNAVDKGDNTFIRIKGVIADLYIECKSGNNYIVEIKNSQDSRGSAMKSIGQLLYYSTIFPQINKLVYFATTYDSKMLDVVMKYNLPLDILLFGEEGVYIVNK